MKIWPFFIISEKDSEVVLGNSFLNKTIVNRLERLRAEMAIQGADLVMIPTADPHQSEYVNDYYKLREYFSGFTGSSGTLLVEKDKAILWTDGRYFVQADIELKGTGITLYKSGEEGVPTVEKYLKETLTDNKSLFVDGQVISIKSGERLESIASKNGARFIYDKDIAGKIWNAETIEGDIRPKRPASKIWIVPDGISGKSFASKKTELLDKLKAEGIFVSKLDDIMWLLNIRANDIECNPVALSYLLVFKDRTEFFVQKDALSKDICDYLQTLNINVHEYDDITAYIEDQSKTDVKLLVDKGDASIRIARLLEQKYRIIYDTSPIELMKAVKNPVEIENTRKYYLKDSVAVTKFIYWLKQHDEKRDGKLTELSAAAYLDDLRSKIDGFVELSFPTISAYGKNAAMMHYEATKDSFATCKNEGFLLVDSGAQYMGATTDVTRTIALGALGDDIKEFYTRALMGMLRLAKAKFIKGATGRNLDILARGPLWDIGSDYKCGTGHGIGYILNVHEGPQNIRWRYSKDIPEAVLEPGMIISDEPGVYVANQFGIRIENILLVGEDVKTDDGQFYSFEHLTHVPVEMDAVDKKIMEKGDIQALNKYNEEVYKMLSPYLEEQEKKWLHTVTRPLD